MNSFRYEEPKATKPGQKVFVLGHRNPDTDAVCAPYCYAWLKNRIDPSKQYIPGILGNLNSQTRFIFDSFGHKQPELIRDLYPKASDVMLTELITLFESDPIGMATELIDKNKVRSIPLINNDGEYRGLVSLLELAGYFMPKHYESRPIYHLRPDNFDKVLPGRYLQRGKNCHIEAQMMVGAMEFETFLQRLKASMQVTASTLPVMIVGNRPEIYNYCLTQAFPILILTGMSAAECENLVIGDFEGWIYVSEVDTAETIRLLRTSIPAGAIACQNLPTFSPNAFLKDVKKTLMNIDHHAIAIVEDGYLKGLVTSSCLIDPPKYQVIMVDHNETAQSAEGIEQAEIIEIIDHHRLGSVRTTKPIYVYSRPLGSSCTLVYQHFQMHDIEPDADIAGLMLSGILTDTVILRSPTTTSEDILAASVLAKIAGLDLAEWGKEIFSHAASLAMSDPSDAVNTDFKVYSEYGYKVGISQMEVITLNDLDQFRAGYIKAIAEQKQKHRLDWAMLLITDIISEKSILLCTEAVEMEALLVYQRLSDGTYYLPGILSRKKQLLPEILRVLEAAANS